MRPAISTAKGIAIPMGTGLAAAGVVPNWWICGRVQVSYGPRVWRRGRKGEGRRGREVL